MIETIIQNYLIDKGLQDIDDNVYMEVPEDPPDRYIVIEKTGSGSRNKIHSAMFAVQSISKNSLVEAARTNQDVIEALEEMADSCAGVYSCSLNNDYNFTDIRAKEYRYQAVFHLTY